MLPGSDQVLRAFFRLKSLNEAPAALQLSYTKFIQHTVDRFAQTTSSTRLSRPVLCACPNCAIASLYMREQTVRDSALGPRYTCTNAD